MSDKLKIQQKDIDLFNFDEYWNFFPYSQREIDISQKDIQTNLHEDYDAPPSSLEGR